MSQSPLWRIGNDLGDVGVKDDTSRELGRTTIKDVLSAIDITNDSNRDVGQVWVANDPGISGTVTVDGTVNANPPQEYQTGASGADISANVVETFTGPLAADNLTFIVDGGGTNSVDVTVRYQDANANTLVVRNYSGSPVYESVAPVSRNVEIEISSGDTGTADYSIYMV